MANRSTHFPIRPNPFIATVVCLARERADSAHPPAPSCYRNRFSYGRVMFGDAQKNRFWSVCGAFSRWTEAISLCLTGTEMQHSEIRKLIIQFMKNHNKKVDDFSNTQNYITKSNMESDKVWATEIEMHFPAAFLSADIYSFTANQWLRFSHSLQLSTKPDYNKMAIYLKHKNSNHFEVVLKVKKIAGFDKQLFRGSARKQRGFISFKENKKVNTVNLDKRQNQRIKVVWRGGKKLIKESDTNQPEQESWKNQDQEDYQKSLRQNYTEKLFSKKESAR
ncbi:hypothetical protein AGLY_008725 [Aphis glycines]|uniref:OTU domain-containing protein n=1 Tax=Aphis glycines TaxID=307491 RepID=A0A6G0TJK1_APHGL|nr:hypothetical protein AGLY_008725 [Aphis glycines]